MIQNIIPSSFQMPPEFFEAILGGIGIIFRLLCVPWRSGFGSSNVPARCFGAGPSLHIYYS
jgi:hypothetical protein